MRKTLGVDPRQFAALGRPARAVEFVRVKVRDLSIRTKLLSLVGLFAASFAVFIIAVSLQTRSRLEDSEYKDVVMMGAVVGDVLPPPSTSSSRISPCSSSATRTTRPDATH